MPEAPTISVVMPAYNLAPFIAECIESVLAQTRRDFEIIVVNDGSTDDTEARIAPYRDRIVYLSHRNSGVMRTRNAGIEAARGQTIAVVDGDDRWEPRYLEVLAGMLDADPQLGAAFPNAWFLGSLQRAGRLYQDIYPVTEPVTFDRVLRRECYIFGSAIFRRSVIEKIGGYDERLKGQGAEDLEMWLRMLRHGTRFAFTREPLVWYRWRRDSLSNKAAGLLRCLISVYETVLAEYELDASQRTWINAYLHEIHAHLDFALFKEMIQAGKYKDASRHLAAANDYYRRPKLALAQFAMKFAPGWVAKLAAR